MMNGLLMMLLMWTLLAPGSLNAETFSPVHPREDAAYTLEKRFTPETALEGLGYLVALCERNCLLPEDIRSSTAKNPAEQAKQEREDCTLGIRNWPGSIEGTILKQDLMITQLRYELALERYRQRKIDGRELEDAKKTYEASERAFRAFWKRFHIAD
jgi:hypothetical protein